MADTEERTQKREERRRRRKEKEDLKNKTNGINDKYDTPDINLNGEPDVSRETEGGLEQRSDSALPDVVKVPSGVNDRPTSPEEADHRGSNGYSGQRYDSDNDAAFEPEVQSPRNEVPSSERPTDDTQQGAVDEWSNVPRQPPKEKPPAVKDRVKTPDKPRDRESTGGNETSRAGRDEWRSGPSVQSRGVNKPPIKKKEDRAWITPILKLPEDPIPQEPDWLDLVRKRRWKSTVKARFPQTERERIQFERRLDTSKKGLKYNPRGEPHSITGARMDDDLSMYLIQQRRRIESDNVFDETSVTSGSGLPDRSMSDSDYDYSGEFSFDHDPRNRELAAAKGILNLSRPPLKGPHKEVHKNLAMEKSRQSTMKWRFTSDPNEEPIWAQLPRPDDIVAINDLDGKLGVKYWANKIKFQTGQFDPPPVLPKPRGRSHSSGEVDSIGFERTSSELRSEEVIPSASRSAVKEMRRKLAAGDFKTSTPLTSRRPMDLEEGYISKLRDIRQRLADEVEHVSEIEKPSYISQEELDSMDICKKGISEELFKEKVEAPKPMEKPQVKRRRSDMELFDLLASRKQEADANAIEMEGEIASAASVVSKAFEKLNASEEIEEEIRRDREKKEKDKEKKMLRDEEEKRKHEEEEKRLKQRREEEEREKERKEDEQRQKEREENEEPAKKQESTLPPEFLVELKDCEVQEGSEISLEVVVSGEPTATVEWCLDDGKLSNDKRHKMVSHGTVHSLTITNVNMDEDEGIYECIATNSAGRASCDCEVLVNED